MIRYSSRLNYDVACTMNFRRFPFDIQVDIKLDHQKFCFPSNWPCLKFVSFSSHTFFGWPCVCVCLTIPMNRFARSSLSRSPTRRRSCSFSGGNEVLLRCSFIPEDLEWLFKDGQRVLKHDSTFLVADQSSVLHSPGEPGHHPGPVCSECWAGGQLQDGLIRPGVPRSYHDYKVTLGR